MNQGKQATWSSRSTMLLAVVGAAVGLGNIWRFPYLAGSSGGGAFVLIYLLAVVSISVPLLIGELMLGRIGRGSPPQAVRRVAEKEGRSPKWALLGWLGVVATFLILTYYTVVTGWAVAYVLKALRGELGDSSVDTTSTIFDSLLANPTQMMLWHGVVVAVAVVVVGGGLQRGIEPAIRVLMAILFLCLLSLLAYAMVFGDFGAAWSFLFAFDLTALDGRTVLLAVGQAFFSVGVGGALMLTYGSYFPRDVPIPVTAVTIAGADTLVALISGLAIFPLVFAHGLDPAEGPGLLFVTLPLVFAASPGGTLLATTFFVLLVVAAITSIIAGLEGSVSSAVDRGVPRGVAAVAAGIGIWTLGLATVFSFNHWSEIRPLAFLTGFEEMGVFESIDHVVINVMLPISALILAIFVGWFVAPETSKTDLPIAGRWTHGVWLWLLRLAIPAALLMIIISVH